MPDQSEAGGEARRLGGESSWLGGSAARRLGVTRLRRYQAERQPRVHLHRSGDFSLDLDLGYPRVLQRKQLPEQHRQPGHDGADVASRSAGEPGPSDHSPTRRGSIAISATRQTLSTVAQMTMYAVGPGSQKNEIAVST